MEPQAKSTRVISSALLINDAIGAAEFEGNEELVNDLLRVKQTDAWRRHNKRILDMTETPND